MSNRASHSTNNVWLDRFETFKIELAGDAAHVDSDLHRVNGRSDREPLRGRTRAAMTNGRRTPRG